MHENGKIKRVKKKLFKIKVLCIGYWTIFAGKLIYTV